MYDVIVIGSGPSGMMASIIASENNKVLLLEKNKTSGKKLLLTGGGRCNLTNLKTNDNFLEQINYNKKYLYSIINTFGPQEVYNYFTSKGVKLKEEDNNKIFPVSNNSKEILNCLLKQMNKVTINYNEPVINIEIKNNIKEITTSRASYKTNNLIIATGGSNYRDTGSSGDNLKFAKMLNQPITNIYPAEVGVVLKEDLSFLAGSTINKVIISYMKNKREGNLIFTHKGLSGSAIMLLSEFIAEYNEKEIIIDLLPDLNEQDLLKSINSFNKDKELKSFLNIYFSKRISNYITDKLEINCKIKSISEKNKIKVINTIKNFKLEVVSTDKLDFAYVTKGGIDIKYINSKTLESTINKGVYFIGESLDIHGPIGGYNITLALSTGYNAGISINETKESK